MRDVHFNVGKTHIRIAVLVAVHNRWEKTSALLLQLKAIESDKVKICIHVTDDGSSDETFQELQKMGVHVIHGSGELYWAKSMKAAEISVTDMVDYLLWLNNDVSLSDHFFDILVENTLKFPDRILVGQTIDEKSGSLSYGGLLRIGKHPHRFKFVGFSTQSMDVDTFCGNVVAIPFWVNQELGGIDGNYQHGLADYDYGLRARSKGIRISTLPGIIGNCSRNIQFTDSRNPLKRFRYISGVKFLPVKSQLRYCRRHGGLGWPIYFSLPYLRAIFGISSRKVDGKSGAF